MSEPAAGWYRVVRRIAFGTGIVASPLSLLWLLGGAGIYGSPVAGAFETSAGHLHDFEKFMFFLMLAGPFMILPCTLLEFRRKGLGAVALLLASVLAASFALKAGHCAWGFDEETVLLLWAFLIAPMIALSMTLLATTGHRRVLGAAVIGLGGAAILLGWGYSDAFDGWDRGVTTRPERYPLSSATRSLSP